jgi:hypothetical protein
VHKVPASRNPSAILSSNFLGSSVLFSVDVLTVWSYYKGLYIDISGCGSSIFQHICQRELRRVSKTVDCNAAAFPGCLSKKQERCNSPDHGCWTSGKMVDLRQTRLYDTRDDAYREWNQTYIAVDQLSVSDYGDDSKQTQQIDLLGRKDSACDSSFGSYQQNASTACDVASAASARGRDPKGPERKAIVLSSAFDWSSSEDEDAKSGLIRPFWRKKQNKEADTKAKGVKGTSKSKDPEGKNEKRKFSAKKMSFSLHGRKGGCVDKEV